MSDGSFQGDAASIYICRIFISLPCRSAVSVIRPNPPFHPETLLPIGLYLLNGSMQSADNGDFADHENVLRSTLSICKEILEQRSLLVNEDKTQTFISTMRVKMNSMRRVNPGGKLYIF